MTKLKVGDIFSEEVKLRGRKCFIVEMIKDDHLICTDRNDYKKEKTEIKKPIRGMVAFLRNVKDKPIELTSDLNSEINAASDFGGR